MRIALMAGAAIAALVATADTAAQMRPGQPQVLTPAPKVAPPMSTPWAALRERLGSRNRVMLFWESELAADVATRYRDVETLDRRVHGNAAQVAAVSDRYDGAVGVAVAGANAHLHERRETFVEGEGPAQATLSGEARSLQAEFMAHLRQGGVRFIDRTLATRLAGRSADGERPNVHAIETEALVGHADYLMEVTSRADDDAASGRRYHVALRSVATGETVLDFDTTAEPDEPMPGAYVAGRNGFERAAPKATAPTESARLLALETGRQMANAMVRR